MRKILSSLALVILIMASLGSTALAAKPAGGGGKTTTPVGNDISWPQCGKTLPSGQAFGIVGVNGGLANNANGCLHDQLTWGTKSTGAIPAQAKLQLYVNTGNPGQEIQNTTTWPTAATAPNPYTECNHDNTDGCSWQYGWNRAQADVSFFTNAVAGTSANPDPAAYTWWLDVETGNSWQSGSADALHKNLLTLEAMTKYFTEVVGAKVGVYSTGSQWRQIVGTVSSSSNVYPLNSWLAGARNLSGAQSNCSLPPLNAGGKVILTQYVSGSLDYDYSCS